MSHEETTPEVKVIPADKAKIWGIWKVMLILLGITALEFVIAFMMDAGSAKTIIFIVLTVVKAFFIVGEFMHLKHETKSLIWSILLPLIFIVFMLYIFSTQGSALYELLY